MEENKKIEKRKQEKQTAHWTFSVCIKICVRYQCYFYRFYRCWLLTQSSHCTYGTLRTVKKKPSLANSTGSRSINFKLHFMRSIRCAFHNFTSYNLLIFSPTFRQNKKRKSKECQNDKISTRVRRTRRNISEKNTSIHTHLANAHS